MKNCPKNIVWLIAAFLLSTMAMAQEDAPDQLQNGEAGYKIGCSAAATLGIPSCGELPSGRQFQNDEELLDMGAADDEGGNDGEDAGQSSTSQQFEQVLRGLNNALQNWQSRSAGSRPAPTPSPVPRTNQRNSGYIREDDCPPGSASCH